MINLSLFGTTGRALTATARLAGVAPHARSARRARDSAIAQRKLWADRPSSFPALTAGRLRGDLDVGEDTGGAPQEDGRRGAHGARCFPLMPLRPSHSPPGPGALAHPVHALAPERPIPGAAWRRPSQPYAY